MTTAGDMCSSNTLVLCYFVYKQMLCYTFFIYISLEPISDTIVNVFKINVEFCYTSYYILS